MATVPRQRADVFGLVGALVQDAVSGLGDLALFSGRTFSWMFRRRPCSSTLMLSFYQVGVRSVPVVAVTGTFIGMVLAVQSYAQFHQIGMASRLGNF